MHAQDEFLASDLHFNIRQYIKHAVWGIVHFGCITLVLTEAIQSELKDYLLLDLQGVHVVIALGCVLLGVGLGINEHIVFVP